MRMKNRLNKDYIFRILSYEPKSGIFIWLEQRGRAVVGMVAGAKSVSRGKTYIYIKIDKRLYKAHHLAWLFQHGEWPSFDLDHIDGDGTNNAIANLRKCTMSQNKANSKRYKNNKSGAKGVSREGNKYVAYIQFNKKRMRIGLFNTIEEASVAYWKAAQKLFGKFARAE